MNTHSTERNSSLMLYMDDNVDYGYEDHVPDPRYFVQDIEVANRSGPTAVTSCFAFRSPSDFSHNSLTAGTGTLGDVTEVSQSPSPSWKGNWSRCALPTTSPIGTISGLDSAMLDSDSDEDTDDDSNDYEAVIAAAAMATENCLASGSNADSQQMTVAYPPMPPDRQARKQRSFHRRGGEVHGALLKSAVMASMSLDFDDSADEGSDEKFPGADGFRNVRRESCQSSISLQSLQDALRSETSPRKRARRGQRRASFDDDDTCDEDDNAATGNASVANHSQDMMEASDLFVTMRVGNGDGRNLLRTSGGSTHLRTSGGSTHLRTSGGSNHLRSSGSSHFRSSASSCGDFSAAASAVANSSPVPKREPPPRRVSRKTSYDSRVSDYDSDLDSDDWDE
jgi:hypothetical protein